MMRVVVTGGTGLIGERLVRDLAADGHAVTVLTRSPEKYSGQFSDSVTLARWDARRSGSWMAAVDGADAVVNLAGESISGSGFLPDRWDSSKKERILQSRLQAGEALVAAIEAAEQKPGVLVQASAVGYYGSTGDKPIDESAPPGNDFLAKVTVAWEASTAVVESMGVRRPVARIGLVLSTKDGALPRLLFPTRLFAGGWFGSGQQWWSWIHIADTVAALRFLIEEPEAAGPVNVTAPNPVTNKEFGQTLGRVMNRPALMPVPGFALRMALGEVADTVLEGQRVLPKRLQAWGFPFQYPQLEAALNDLVKVQSEAAS